MRKSVFAKYKNVLMAAVTVMLMLAFSPVTAMAADGETPSAAVADERVAWAKRQTISHANTLDAERGTKTDASTCYFQDFVSSYTGVARTFEYRLVPLDEANPMPQNSENGVYAWTFEGDDTGWVNIDFSDVVVTEGEKVFYYAACQNIPEPQPWYTYDDRVYYVDVHVLANGQGVIANVRESSIFGDKVDDPGWTVTYEKPNEDQSDTGETTTRPTQSGTYSSTYTPAGSPASNPKTGDITNHALATLLFVCALIASVAGIRVRFAKGDGRRG